MLFTVGRLLEDSAPWSPAALFASSIVALGVVHLLRHRKRRPTRRQRLAPTDERVLILGASDGIGKELALHYALRGASICLVARTTSKLEEVAAECRTLLLAAPSPPTPQGDAGVREAQFRTEDEVSRKVLAVTTDFTDVDALLAVRHASEDAWRGLDTVHIVAGVLSTRTFAALSGSTRTAPTEETAAETCNQRAKASFGQTAKEGVQAVLNLARTSMETNYLGPLLSYATFLPFLSTTSSHPTIVLLSTVAAVLPTPTRTLYSGSKGAVHAFLASLALESAVLGLGVQFVEVLAGSVNTSLRTRAVDNASGETDEPPSKWALEPDYVAERVIAAVDGGRGDESRGEALMLKQVWLPERPFRWAHLLYWLPGGWTRALVEDGARKKYAAALNRDL